DTAAQSYREALVRAEQDETIRTSCYSGKPLRSLRNRYIAEHEADPSRIRPFPEQLMISAQRRVMAYWEAQADPERTCFPAGQGVGAFREIKPAGELLREIVTRGERVVGVAAARTRLALEPCLGPAGFCPPLSLPDPTAPVVFPDHFPAAVFYWLADARLTLAGGGRARLTLAVEGSFVHGVVVPGDQFVLGRVRMRADGLVAGATYTFTHPYGIDVLQADGAGRVDVSNTVGTPGFAGPLGSRVGPFLVWDASSPAPPPGFVGTPDVDHP